MNDVRADTRVVVALDHSLHWGVHEGFENPRATLEAVLDGDPDGVLASVSLLRRFSEFFESYPTVERIATLDLIHDSTVPGIREDGEIHSRVFSAHEAARIGADAAKVAVVYGRKRESVLRDNIEFAAGVAEECRSAGLPLVVEPTLWGSRIDDELDPERLADAARIAFELGADIIKSPYPGTDAEFTPIGEDLPLPVYIAGGPAVESDRDVLGMVAGAVDDGARGVMFGRNIWQRPDPAAMIDAIDAVITGAKTVEEADGSLR